MYSKCLNSYKYYITLEKRLSNKTTEMYIKELKHFFNYVRLNSEDIIMTNIAYNSGGYTGTLYPTDSITYTTLGTWPMPTVLGESKVTSRVKLTETYSGTVTKPASDTRIYQQDYSGTVTKSIPLYSQNYSGIVTKPDTRVYRQDYSGTVYKAGTDYFYKYIVTIEYIDNQNPILTTVLPNANSCFSKDKAV